MENEFFNEDVTARIFFLFLELKYERNRVHFCCCSYIDMHMVKKREKCAPVRLYISNAVNVEAELNVYVDTCVS